MVIPRYLPVLLAFLCVSAQANIHGVQSVRIVPAEEPPEYDLSRIQGEASKAIKRSARTLGTQVAILTVVPEITPRDKCGNVPGLDMLCELGNAIELAGARAESRKTIEELKRAHVASDPELASDLADVVDNLLASKLLQVRLARAVRDVVADQTTIDVSYGQVESRATHRLETRLVKVDATGSYVDSSVAIRLTGRADLVSIADESVVDSYVYAIATPSYFLEGWSQGGVRLLAASVTDSIESMARVLTEEILLTVASPGKRRRGYLVQAVAPKNKNCLMRCEFVSQDMKGYFATKTLRPTFEWEDFRDVYARDPYYPDVAAYDLDVSYDFRVFRSRHTGLTPRTPLGEPMSDAHTLIAGEQVIELRGIRDNTVTPDFVFAGCMPYTWAVRARFVANGKTHLTQWAGNYSEQRIEKYRETRKSDSKITRTGSRAAALMGMDPRHLWDERNYYFPFLVTAPGQKCKESDVFAAMAAE